MIYKRTDSQHSTKNGKMSECVIDIITQYQIALYYKYLSVGCLWSRLLWYYRSFVNIPVLLVPSQRLSSSVEFVCHSTSVFRFDLLRSRKRTVTHVCASKHRVHF